MTGSMHHSSRGMHAVASGTVFFLSMNNVGADLPHPFPTSSEVIVPARTRRSAGKVRDASVLVPLLTFFLCNLRRAICTGCLSVAGLCRRMLRFCSSSGEKRSVSADPGGDGNRTFLFVPAQQEHQLYTIRFLDTTWIRFPGCDGS